MLNKDNQRELAYVVKIDDVTPIEGYDRVELAHVGGWTVVVGKGEFKAGDPAIYFEIDSQLPEVEPFTNMAFLATKHYKIKTQKMCKSISQGLLMSAENFGWNICGCGEGGNATVINGIVESDGTVHLPTDESRFLTEKLGVTYYVPEDNIRKAKPANKYARMVSHYGKLFSHQPFRWLMKREWGKQLLLNTFGRFVKSNKTWPAWVVKTDEERVQNMPWILNEKDPWVATEKIDGSSSTYSMIKIKKWFGIKYKFYICSRNVVMNEPGAKCYYDTDVYSEIGKKYDMAGVLRHLLDEVFPEAEWVTLQGEIYGPKIQNRDYSIKERDFAGFNLITSNLGRLNSIAAKKIMEGCNIPWVPILDVDYILPDTIDDLLAYAASEPSKLDGGMREGVVFRSQDGQKSFKAVSNEYLLKYHG